MITADDYELVEAVLAATDSNEPAALRLLRDECGWTLRHGYAVLQLVRAAQGAHKIGEAR